MLDNAPRFSEAVGYPLRPRRAKRHFVEDFILASVANERTSHSPDILINQAEEAWAALEKRVPR